MERDDVVKEFIKLYGESSEKTRIFYSPGRVNLIGEHTDYNGGYVFPCALSFGTYAVARRRRDNVMKFASTNFELKAALDSSDIVFDSRQSWVNYPKGVIKLFREEGFPTGGFEVLYSGNIPNGAGLSSSASIELVTAAMLNGLFSCNVEMLEMVKLCQKAENTFVGVNCGIMDQFAIGMGKKDHAVLLNCNSMDYKYVPLKLDGYKIVIANTNKRRRLADSKYNERRAECEAAVGHLNKKLDIHYLAELNAETFEKYKYLIVDETVLKRASHVVYENIRCLDAVDKLNAGDLSGFGRLMNLSHESLRDLYEVTGIELDILAEEAWNIDGVLGSRMTGAGFGGCTVSIVREDAVERFKTQVGENYKKRTGLTADFYTAAAGDGTKEL